MKICFVADARSPIAENWIKYFLNAHTETEVFIVSTALCDPSRYPGAVVYQLPLRLSKSQPASVSAKTRNAPLESIARRFLTNGGSFKRQLIGDVQIYLSLANAMRKKHALAQLFHQIRPDIIHAMRVPCEGIFAGSSNDEHYPMLISIWGNDFTLHAARSPLLTHLTKKTLRAADAMQTDCERDAQLALHYGYDQRKPTLVVPGGGGIQRRLFQPRQRDEERLRRLNIPPDAQVVINPRGVRMYVHNDHFFKAIPAVLEQAPNTYFVCIGMAGNPVVMKWLVEYGIADRVRLLPLVSREEIAALFQLSHVIVSPSLHDGVPNTLLEALACGCFPVVGDIPTMHEWIEHGVNGLLFDVMDVQAQADALVHALRDHELRARAFPINQHSIDDRADYTKVMGQVHAFYQHIVHNTGVAVR